MYLLVHMVTTSHVLTFHYPVQVLETCVKNCALRLHVKIAQKEFLNDLLRVIQPKVHVLLPYQVATQTLSLPSPSLWQNNPPTIVKERVLGLIQYWADSFRGQPQLGTVEEVYEDLKTQGVEFPPVDLDQLAPVQTHSRVSRGWGYWWVWLISCSPYSQHPQPQMIR